MPTILLVEDDTAIADTVLYALGAEGFATHHALLGLQARQRVAQGGIDLAILDIGLPDIDGFSLCHALRASSPGLPVIFLTARSGEVDRIVGLEIGADDYICKPFSPREVATRVKTVLRRMQPIAVASTQESAMPGQGAFTHDAEGLRIAYHGQWLELTRYEYRLLAALLARPGAVLSRANLMDRVWNDALDTGDRTVDTHVKTLRAKLARIAPGAAIRTHRGLGYSLDARP